MSRRPSDDTAERLRPGKPHNGGHASFNATHVRSSVSFLNPDVSHGATNLERAPSLNRLHAQSSTETSGLGETVTSGFSSQESVLSYVGDERERSGGAIIFIDRSRRRATGSPGSVRTIIEQDFLHRDDGHNVHSRPPQQDTSKQQKQQREQRLTNPHPDQGLDRRSLRTQHEDVEGASSDSRSQEATGHRQRPGRDTGGRSLTPQQAKDEYDERQRRLKQIQKERDSTAISNTSTLQLDKRRHATVVNSLDKQRRPDSVHQNKETVSTVIPNRNEQHLKARSDERRGVLNPSGGNRDLGKSISKTEDYRQNSKGERSDRANVTLGTSKSGGRKSTANRSLPRPSSQTGSKDSVDISSALSPSDSQQNITLPEIVPNSRGRSSYEFSSRDLEKRPSSKSREQLKSQSSSPRTNSDEYNGSSSSKKSFETQILNSQGQSSTLHSSGELIAGSSRIQTAQDPDPVVLEVGQIDSDKKRRRQHASTDVKRSVPKISDDQAENGNAQTLSRKRRSLEDEKDSRGQHRDERVSSKGNNNRDYVQGRPKSSYSRQRSEPLVEGTSVPKDTREYERSKSWDTQTVVDESGKYSNPNLRRFYQEGDKYRNDKKVSESGRGSLRRDVKFSARDTTGQVRDIDLGPILIKRDDVSSSDTKASGERVREKRSREVSGREHVREHSRDRKVDAKDFGDAFEKPRDKAGSRKSRGNPPPPDETYEAGQLGTVKDRQRIPRASEDDKIYARGVDSTRSEREEKEKGMNYERLLYQASRSMNGTGGGGGSREYPASLDDVHSSPSSRRVGGSLYGPSYNNMSKSSHYRVPTGMPSSGGAINIVSSNEHDVPVSQPTSAPYTTFQVPLTPTGPVPTVQLTSPDDPGLNIDNIDKMWERRDSRSSNRSRNSRSSIKGSSRFLGVNTGSAWAKWSRERRASYRRRMEKLEQAETKTTTDVGRVSTPIKKARQEGLKFVHPDLEATYLSEDDINELRRYKQQQAHAMRVIEKNRRHKFRMKNEVKLSPEQWQMLQEFWNHTVFVRARFLGIFLSLVALILMVVSITHHSWLKHSERNLTIVEGLWLNCTQSSVILNASQGCSSSNGRNWQNAVIGLLIFAATFGFLASVLSICGVFTNPLPRKIYYFHSAGEIFFICALSATVALLVFPVSIELDSTVHSHRYGIGYGLGWAGTFFLLAAAVCMSLDDLVRESSRAKCCRWCWRGKHNDRSELRQV